MNKQIFLSLALISLVSFSSFYALEDNKVVNEPVQTQEKQQEKPSESRLRSAVKFTQDKLVSIKNNPVKTASVLALVVAVIATHKVMAVKCPWYKKLVYGENEDEVALPWARV